MLMLNDEEIIMQFRDLKKQYQVLKRDIDPTVEEVMTNCNFISGSQVSGLEKELADYVGVKHCITCANGTDALYLAMLVWQMKKGDAVLVPDFTFFSSAEVVAHAGATPIFVDVDADTYNVDTVKLEKKIEEVKAEGKYNLRAIIAVDLFGLPANYTEIRKIADRHGLLVLEDAAQGFGGEIDRKRACSFGDISTTSFFPAKPLGCYGDGGAVFTDNDEWAELLLSYRVHGKGSTKYDNVRIGLNSRLDTVQVAILKIKLKAFEEYEVRDVNQVADRYTDKLAGLVKLPIVPNGFMSSWAQYTIQLDSKKARDGLQAFLKERDIPSMIYYQKQMHLMEAFDKSIYKHEDYEITNQLCDTVLSLPMHPYLEDDDMDKTVSVIKEYLK